MKKQPVTKASGNKAAAKIGQDIVRGLKDKESNQVKGGIPARKK